MSLETVRKQGNPVTQLYRPQLQELPYGYGLNNVLKALPPVCEWWKRLEVLRSA